VSGGAEKQSDSLVCTRLCPATGRNERYLVISEANLRRRQRRHFFGLGDLTHDLADPIQQLLFLLDGVRDITIFHKNNWKKTLQAYPAGYTLPMGDRIGQAQIPGERRPMLSDGGNSRVREQQTDTDSAEPPFLTDSLL
jgi:hypothetical protein